LRRKIRKNKMAERGGFEPHILPWKIRGIRTETHKGTHKFQSMSVPICRALSLLGKNFRPHSRQQSSLLSARQADKLWTGHRLEPAELLNPDRWILRPRTVRKSATQ
jgi:hypothetical protein